MCQLYFNTSFIKDSYLAFDKSCIDIAFADVYHYTYDVNFKIEICFQQVEDEPALNILTTQRPNAVTNATMFNNSSAIGKEDVRHDLEFTHSYGDTNIPEVIDDDAVTAQ